MADIKISALPGASTLDGTETIPLVQGGTTKKATVSSVWTMVNPSYTGTLTGGTGVVNLGSGQFVKDASGNLGLGVTPSAWNSNVKAFQFGLVGSLACRVSGEGSYLSSNVYYSGDPALAGSGGTYMYSGVSATSFLQADGFYKWFTAPSGTAGNPISFTQAMTLDASGNLLVGGTSVLQSAKLTAYGSVAAQNGGVDGTFANAFVGVYSTNSNEHNAIQTSVSSTGTHSGFRFKASDGGGASTTTTVLDLTRTQTIFYTGGTERARIDASGMLQNYSTADGIRTHVSAAAGGSVSMFVGYHSATSTANGTISFNVTSNGNVTNTNNSYGAISDLKLKENVTDVSPKLSKLMQVRIVNYNLKADPDKTKLIGVVAQELEKVSPGLIEETADFEDVKKTREVTKSVPVTEQVTVQREQKTVEVIDGKAVVTVTLVDEQTAVPVVDQYPLFDADGQPVLEVDTPEVPEVLDEDGNVTQPAAPATYRQALHSVPRMRDVTETEEYTERVPLGTVTKSVKYSVFVPMLVKALQEANGLIVDLQNRVSALEAA